MPEPVLGPQDVPAAPAWWLRCATQPVQGDVGMTGVGAKEANQCAQTEVVSRVE